MAPRGRKTPASKRHTVKVGNGTYSRLLDCAERMQKDPDRLADEVLGPALDRLEAQLIRRQQEAAYRTADDQAKKDGLPTVLRRDFGLPE